jgi:predicted Ser/Thr protein kinase
MEPIRNAIGQLYDIYKEIDFSDIADGTYKNRTISKVEDYNSANNFCDTIDKVKAAYGYRRNDSGSRKQYDATEYTKIVSTYEQLGQLYNQIKEYLIKHNDKEDTVSGESLEKLISQYFTCIDTIVGIMEDDISKLEYFIWNAPEKYTTEYYQQLLYFDRSVIGMYTNR